jgi:hypothetical protein
MLCAPSTFLQIAALPFQTGGFLICRSRNGYAGGHSEVANRSQPHRSSTDTKSPSDKPPGL